MYSYSGDYLTSVAVGNRASSYNYSSSGYLTGILYASGLSRTWSYSENHLVTGTAEYNEDGDLLSSIEVTPRWNGRFRMTTLPQNITTEILYNVNGGTSSFLTPKSPPYVEKISEISPGTTVKTYMYGDQVCMLLSLNGGGYRWDSGGRGVKGRLQLKCMSDNYPLPYIALYIYSQVIAIIYSGLVDMALHRPRDCTCLKGSIF